MYWDVRPIAQWARLTVSLAEMIYLNSKVAGGVAKKQIQMSMVAVLGSNKRTLK